MTRKSLFAIVLLIGGSIVSSDARSDSVLINRAEYCARPSRYLCDPRFNDSGVRFERLSDEFLTRWIFNFNRSDDAVRYRGSLGYPDSNTERDLTPADRIRYRTWFNSQVIALEFTASKRQRIDGMFQELKESLIQVLVKSKIKDRLPFFRSHHNRQLDEKIARLHSLTYSFNPAVYDFLGPDAMILFEGSGYNFRTNTIYLGGDFSAVEEFPEMTKRTLAHEISHIVFYSDMKGNQVPAAFSATREDLRRTLGVQEFWDSRMNEILADWMADTLVSDAGTRSSTRENSQTLNLTEILANPRVRDLTSWFCAAPDMDYNFRSAYGHLSRERRLDLLASRSEIFGCEKSHL